MGKSADSHRAKRRGSGAASGPVENDRAEAGSKGARGAGLRDAEARRELAASEKLYYRIGEVSKLTGVKAHVLRYWETEFRWMAPPKSRSKQRLYRKRDIEFVWLLKRLLWDERYTIAGARQRIQDLGVDNALALLGDAPRDESSNSPSSHVSTDLSADSSSDRKSTELSIQHPEKGEGDPSAMPPDVGMSPDWVSFRAALGEMHSELSQIRGALQEGL